ncbi:Pyridoxine 4-dehydrogenase [Xylographa opegraphella]|nr:Pyridoxine 4-dehydrogenase [Xylographa opegraphella]
MLLRKISRGRQKGPIRASVDEAVKALGGIKAIDIFECARVDSNVPVKASIEALAEWMKEGRIGGIDLSVVGATTIRKAHAVHPILAVEVEQSRFTLDSLNHGIADAWHEHIFVNAIARYASSTSTLQSDFRRMLPRFQPDIFDQNIKLVKAVKQIAKRKGVTTAHVVIGWVCRPGAIPISCGGSIRVERIIENGSAALLSHDDMAEMQNILDTMPISGQRCGDAHEKLLDT